MKKTFAKIRYSPSCDCKVVNFKFDKKGSWIHISDVEKLMEASKDALRTLEKAYAIESDRRQSIRLLKQALSPKQSGTL